jgi:hypothetical protein
MTINEMEAQPAEAPDFSQTPSRHPPEEQRRNKFHHPLASAKKNGISRGGITKPLVKK